MTLIHPNPDWRQREEICRLIKETRGIIAATPESLTDSPSPVADVVCNVVGARTSERLSNLRRIVAENIADEHGRRDAIGLIDEIANSYDAWLVGEVVEGVLVDPLSRIALNEVGLHVTTQPPTE